jgi:thiol-disulfide isomerase/thioredoxin
MQVVNNTITHVQNLPKIKKIILLLMLVVVILFILEIINTYYNNKQKFKNIIDGSKKTIKKIEKMDSQTINNSTDNTSSSIVKFGDVTLDTNKTNVTLYFAHWCGHCKQFLNSTWNKVSEHYGTESNINLNTVDCTDLKTEIKTPAGKSIQGFPTVIINYKNAEGEYIEEEYSGGRSFEVFSKYIEQVGLSN